MQRILVIAAFVVVSQLSLCNVQAAAPNADKILQSGKLAAGEAELAKHLKANPKDDKARFGLATVQLMRGVERLMQALHKYGTRERQNFVPFLRLPAPNNVEPEEIRYEDMRKIFENLQADLTKTEKTLAGITSKDVKLPLHFAMIKFDFNGDGKLEDRETLWQVFVKLTRARGIPEAVAKAFVINFDRGDVHWLRGYCHLLLGITDFILAYDWKENFNATAQLFFKAADSPYAFLRRADPKKRRGLFDEDEIADVIAFIHLIRFDLKEPKRMQSALAHFEAMIAQSKESWKHIEAETDNDREWIPNAKQKSIVPGVRMTAERIKIWKQFLDEADKIFKGKKLIKHWRIDDGRGVNLRKVFTKPGKFDLVMWIQGAAAKPYLERGKLTDKQFWWRLMRTFEGNFIGFAIWLN